MIQASHTASEPSSSDDIFVGAILLGGGGGMCGVGKRINVPVHEASRFEEKDERVGMIERNDAHVDWMRFGGEKGWTLRTLYGHMSISRLYFDRICKMGSVPRLKIF
jgi:hypothetical protein